MPRHTHTSWQSDLRLGLSCCCPPGSLCPCPGGVRLPSPCQPPGCSGAGGVRGTGVTERGRHVVHRKAGGWSRTCTAGEFWGLAGGRGARAVGSGVPVSLCSVVGGCRALWAHSSVCGAAAGGSSWLVGCCWAVLGTATGFPFLRQGERRRLTGRPFVALSHLHGRWGPRCPSPNCPSTCGKLSVQV